MDKETRLALQFIEQEIETLHSKVDALPANLGVEINRRLDHLRQTIEDLMASDRASNIPTVIREENSAEINIGGAKFEISKALWDKHGAKIKWVLFAAVTTSAGWFAKLFHIAYNTLQK